MKFSMVILTLACKNLFNIIWILKLEEEKINSTDKKNLEHSAFKTWAN